MQGLLTAFGHARLYLHVPIGFYSLPVPLLQILIAAVIVVAGSFVLIYAMPSGRRRPSIEPGSPYVPEPFVWQLQAVAGIYLVFLIATTLFGRQGLAALNAGSLLFWVFTVPLLPILHCVVGGVYTLANPFAAAADLLSGGRHPWRNPELLDRLGYWPAVVLLFLVVEGESVSQIVQNPAILGYAAVFYAALQVSAGMLFGRRWYRGGEVFQALTMLASTVSLVGLKRDRDGWVRLVRGFNPSRFLLAGRGRNALITLWLAGVLADGVRATPIWRAVVAPAVGPTFESMGRIGGFDVGAAAEITFEILVTWIAFGIFFWAFTGLAALLSGWTLPQPLTRERLTDIAAMVAPSLVPISLAYLLAHNLTQLLVVGPLIVTARDAAASQLGVITTAQIRLISPHVGMVWWVQSGAIVLGHVIAVVIAHERFGELFRAAAAAGAVRALKQRAAQVQSLALKADLGWLSAMLIYTATSLWVLAQPITTSG